MRLSVVDGVLHAVMLGACESYLGALAVELGHRGVAISILATVPLLCGALAQLGSARLVRALGGEKRVVLIGASVQALSHAGFAALALSGSDSLSLFLGLKVVYWVSFMGHAPAWSAWMARVVPSRLRGSYFARRLGVHQAALLVAFLLTGFALDAFRGLGDVLTGFACFQAVALVARFLGALVLSRQPTLEGPRPLARRAPTLSFVLRAGRWRVALFAAAMLLGAQLAVPFFTPYMLDTLGLDLGEFAILTSISIAAKVVAFPLWRRAVPRLGGLAALVATGALISVVPLFWAVSDSFGTLVVAQVVGGVAWAGYELVSLQLLMGDAPKEAPVEFFALAGSLSGVTQVAGAVLGGIALEHEILDYHGIFMVSAIGRGLALLALVPLAFTGLRLGQVFSRVVSVRPGRGSVAAAVVLPRPSSDPGPGEP